MSKRKKLSYRGGKKLFSSTASKTHRRNYSKLRVMRGGTRL